MLPSCRQVAEQLSENIDQPLTGVRWLKMKLHLLICDYCRRYGKQIELSAKTTNLVKPEVEEDDALKQKLLQHYRDCHQNKSKD